MNEESRIILLAPVRKSLRVNASVSRAFDIFTRHIRTWWPASHTPLKAPPKDTIIEPYVNGRWYQIAVDGTQCNTGRVLVWEPPFRLVLSWQINAEWQYDPDLMTEVEIKFAADGEGVTRVELEHRHLERLGAKAEEFRGKADAPTGWPAILENYQRAVEAKKAASAQDASR